MEEIGANLNIFNNTIILLSVILVIYWIYLIIKYEYDKNLKIYYPDDLELMNIYNPIVAVCIAQKRDMQPRDVIAILLNLVNKRILKLEVETVAHKNSSKKIYKLTKNKQYMNYQKEYVDLDEIEKRVIDLFFEDINDVIELEKQFKKINTESKLLTKLKVIRRIVDNKLNELGHGLKKVPENVIGFNNFIMIVVCITVFINLIMNILYISNEYSYDILGAFDLIEHYLVIIIAIVILVGLVLVYIFRIIGRNVERLLYKLTPSKINRIIFFYILMSLIFLSLVIIIFNKDFVIYNAMLLLVSICLTSTDNLLSRHCRKLMKTFYCLRMLEDKLKKGSLLKEKKIIDVILWEKYLVYAIAFDISNVNEYTKILDSDDVRNIRGFTYDSVFCTRSYLDFVMNILTFVGETLNEPRRR